MSRRTKVALVTAALIVIAVGAAQAAGQLYLADVIFNWLNRLENTRAQWIRF